VRLGLFVFIDAFGWKLLQRHRFLPDLLPHRQPLDTVFGYSSTCDPTIITGVPPREHGHFSFFRYGPATSPFRPLAVLDLLPDAVTRRGRVRHWISRLVGAAYGYTGYFQLYNIPFRDARLFDYSEKRDLYQPGGINGGQPTIFDHLRGRGIPFHLSDWRRGEEENLASLTAAIGGGEIRFAYLYMAAMDGILHEHGTGSERVARKIEWYADRIRRLHDAARGRFDDVRLFVFSDHGMTDVRATCDVMARVAATGLRFGTDYAAVYDSTMARFWFLRPGAAERIGDALAAEPAGRWLDDATLAAWGCDFPGRAYGERIFLMNPGVLLLPSHMGVAPLKGMHGYEPGHEDSVAMLASSVPPEPAPAGLADLYRLMRAEVER
jgi:hypothetical protein